MTPSGWLSLGRAPVPRVAVELAPNRITAAAIERRGNRTVVGVHASAPLPAGALQPSLTEPNIRGRSAVAAALNRVLEHVGTPRRIGLVLPDPVAKVSVLRLAHVPDRDDLDEVIRWQMKKAAPFPLDEGQLSYVEGWRSPEGQDFVISLARREVVAEYESICASAGAHAGLVDTSTLNVVNALLAQGNTPSGDWMLIQIASGYASIVVLRGQNPIFFRSRADSETGSLSDLVHQTTMYYEDRLKGAGLGRVVVSGVGEAQASDVGEIRRTVESRLRMAVEAADLRPMVTLPDNVTPMPGAPGVPGIPGIVDALTPLVGLLVRDAG